MSRQRYEQGGVVSFLVVATVLAGMLGFALWYAKQQAPDTVAVQETTKTDEGQQQSGQSSGEPSTSSTTGNDEDTPTGSSSETTKTDASASGSGAATSTDEAHDGGEAVVGVARSGPTEQVLPSTGPSDMVLATLSGGVFGLASYAYFRSRQHVRSSALK